MKDAIVEMAAGKVEGALTANGIYAFKGIPYAEDTGGENRFKPPLRKKGWTGIRDATSPGYASPQPHRANQPALDPTSEDCLVLNIWTPGLASAEARPVMVWLHGGGFYGGVGLSPNSDGAALARRGDLVVVSLNHRLGALGYLHLGDIASPDFAKSGNVGMLDIVAALEWVRENISAFGGDPGNVTIFGQSGGGGKVSYLLGMPAAHGLFHKAIIMSGPRLRAISRDEATEIGEEFIHELGLQRDQFQELQRLPVERLVQAQLSMSHKRGELVEGRGGFVPVLDGDVLPAHPFDPAASPFSAGVPLMIGSTKDEMTYLLRRNPGYPGLDEEQVRDILAAGLADRRDRIHPPSDEQRGHLIAAYKEMLPGAAPDDLAIRIWSDATHIASVRLAERKIARDPGSNVFMYYFAWESPAEAGTLKATHALDVAFAFDNVNEPRPLIDRSDRHDVAARYSSAYIAFARAGNPGHEGLPPWPSYSYEGRNVMRFDSECRLESSFFLEQRLAWEGIG